MASIDILGLSNRLQKQFKTMGLTAVRKRASKIKADLTNVKNQWIKDIQDRLSTPASNRGYIGNSKRLNPHNRKSQNTSFPMLVTGQLRDSIMTKVTMETRSDGVVIKVLREFRASGFDYGEVLNRGGKHGKNPQLTNWKQRAYDLLEKRVHQIVSTRKGF